jgi:hypothetical protein
MTPYRGAADRPLLVVPAYFHPALRAADWERLATWAHHVRLIVLNVASGAGEQPDEAFLPVLARLRESGVVVAGYVDTAYGRRSPTAALLELHRYQDWYDVQDVFFDQVSTTPQHVGHYAALADRARQRGATLVAFNHGAHPVEAYAQHADLLGTFEGPWRAYVDAAVPRWVRARPAHQFFHLVHSAPRAYLGDAFGLARKRNAVGAYVTDRAGDNPWDRLPDGPACPEATSG